MLLTVGESQSAPRPPIANHADFVAEWFPENAASAVHLELSRTKVLAAHTHSGLARFALTESMLELVRTRTGIDPILVDQITSAMITTGLKGTVIFFSTSEVIPVENLSDPEFAPIDLETHRFKGKQVYHDPDRSRPLGIYSPDGVNFIIGDWAPFKATLMGVRSRESDLVDSIQSHAAPIILCSDPRRTGKRWRKDDLFGTVTVIDFDESQLVLQMLEEHPTPAAAAVRRKSMETEIPSSFEKAYGFKTKDGVRYIAKADGRNAIFGMQGPIEKVDKLLTSMLGATTGSDPRSFARKRATEAVELILAASAAGADFSGDHSKVALLTALQSGIGSPGGKRFKLPFMTVVERSMVSEFLLLDAGLLALAPESLTPPEPEGKVFEMKQLHRSARVISALTMSAASADCLALKENESTEKIIELLCSKGLSGSGVYEDEHFEGPKLSEAERTAIADLLVKSNGYLVYRPEGK